MDTGKAVEKLRKEAQELREELRQKNNDDRERLGGQWGKPTKKTKKKKKKASNQILPAQQQKIEKADAVLNRLLQDTQVRRIQKE